MFVTTMTNAILRSAGTKFHLIVFKHCLLESNNILYEHIASISLALCSGIHPNLMLVLCSLNTISKDDDIMCISSSQWLSGMPSKLDHKSKTSRRGQKQVSPFIGVLVSPPTSSP